ncbi:hypothetical protein GCM10027423_32040 [Spirosoma arcticum]
MPAISRPIRSHFGRRGRVEPFRNWLVISQAAAIRARLMAVTKTVSAIESTVVDSRCIDVLG